MTDINGLHGATVFYQEALDAGLRPIVGAELRAGGAAAVALISDRTGYENLCRAITRIRAAANNEGRFDLAADLPAFAEGLHVFTESIALAESLLAGGMPARRLWLELDPPTQSGLLGQRLGAAGKRLGIGLLATGRAMMATADDADAARVLASIRRGVTIDTVSPADLPHPKAVLRAPEQWRAELAGFDDALANNVRVADECRFRLLPQSPVFPDFACPKGLSPLERLRQLCAQGVRKRYGRITSAAAGRIRKELTLIETKGFSEYFLVVREIVRYAHRRNMPIAGRGSGASSLVAYALGITNVCPLALDIPFERFLNERREDFPDLDIDFGWRFRDEVIDYAFDRWGHDRVAMVSTHNTFQPKSAFREVAKAFGLSDRQISDPASLGERSDSARMRRIATLSERIVGLPHLLSVHPGGIVIGRKPIDHYAPVERAAKGVMITQYDKNGVEDIGLIKLDLLGNRNLSTIRQACELVSRRRPNAPPFKIDAIAPDDPATFELIGRADTVGCNQLESPAMRHLLRCMAPRELRDVMKALALIRPGAASIGMKDVFIRRQRGVERTPAGHVGVDRVLRNTHGVMLYEDDVMLVAAEMLGTPLAEADRFRKAVQKCRNDRQRLELSTEFLDGCTRNGMDLEFAKTMWVQMAKFNAYSFCRAHAASYARLAYAGAYLKTHHPLEFWAAALNNNQGMYHPRVYVQQARRAGVRFVLPDVNRSNEEFAIDGDAIRVGFNRIGGLGPVSIRTILDRRTERPFAGVSDFLDRTRMPAEEMRSLILCGAFDGFARSRPTLMMERSLWRPSKSRSGPALLAIQPTITVALDDYDDARKHRQQRQILKISVDRHPISDWRPALAGRTDIDSRQLACYAGRRIRIAGLVEAARSTQTQRGRAMRFFSFDDEYGLFEVTAFPAACRMTGVPEGGQPAAIITGRVDNRFDCVTVSAEEIAWKGQEEL